MKMRCAKNLKIKGEKSFQTNVLQVWSWFFPLYWDPKHLATYIYLSKYTNWESECHKFIVLFNIIIISYYNVYKANFTI